MSNAAAMPKQICAFWMLVSLLMVDFDLGLFLGNDWDHNAIGKATLFNFLM